MAGPVIAGLLTWAAGGHAAEPLPLVIDGALVRTMQQVDVAAQEAGLLISLPIDDGQAVAADELLAQIDDTDAQLAANQAEQEWTIASRKATSDVRVRYASKSRDVAQAEWQRGRDSVEKYRKSLSQTELDRLRLEAERAELEVEQAQLDQELARFEERLREIEWEAARRQVQRRRIVAPLSGVVVEIKHHPGEWVEPGETVMRIMRVDRLRIEGFLDSPTAAVELVGRAATFTREGAGPEATGFSGQISFVSPEIDPVSGQVRIWAEVDNPGGRLRPGERGRLTIAGAAPTGR